MYKGSCHCKKVSWVYPLKIESITACNCTLCSRYGALWAYGYLDDGIKTEGETEPYAHANKINSFHFCTNCGCLAYYMANKKDDQGRTRIAVNTRMISDPNLIFDKIIDHFEGRESFTDLPHDGRNVKDLWF
jgi:hypothetical protein